MELKDYYTVKELAALLNMLPQSVRRLINEKQLKATKLNNIFLIKKEDAAELIKSKGGTV